MNDILRELNNALWVTKKACRDSILAFCHRWTYWWINRSHRDTVDEVERWHKHPEKCPY